MSKIKIPKLNDITIESFIDAFHNIVKWKKENNWNSYYNNPDKDTLLNQALFYGEKYANGSVGWSSNIWSRSQASSDVVADSKNLDKQHKFLMRSVLEYILAPNPLIKVDGVYGQNERVKMHTRVWVDSRYPDLALRWRELVFPANKDDNPQAELIVLPGLWTPAVMPKDPSKPLFIIRFPEHNFTIITVSSYQGEIKKGALCHWIYHVYKKGGTGVHASSREFTVLNKNNKWKKVGMVIWGLTGSGKSTHGMYAFDANNAEYYEKRGIKVLEIVKDQFIKNDDIVALFEEGVYGSERGSWTKTEDVSKDQVAIYNAGMSPKAMHENTEKDKDGNPNFKGEILQYRGLPNRNSRTVMFLEDMKPYFNGSVDIDFPPNMAIFISPGYLSDYAWLKINDPNFAAAILAAGRTVGHPAQGTEGIGEEKYSPLYNPFIIGVTNTDHVHRFREILVNINEKAKSEDEKINSYLINTTGNIGTEYKWEDGKPKPIFKVENGKKKPVGGTGPKIEETELFLLQAARGLVEYEPHPFWGEKVLVPKKVEGLEEERLKDFNPFTYRTKDEMKKLLEYQIKSIKEVFDKKLPGLDKKIYNALDF